MITETTQNSTEKLSRAQKNKAYREANIKRRKAYCKERYLNNKDRIKENSRNCREANADKRRDYTEKYYIENKNKIKQSSSKYREANIDERRIYSKKYRILNKDKIYAIRKNRRQTDELYRMKCCMRNVVTGAFKRIQMNKPADTETLLGCSWQEAKEHFEKLFEPGMTWMNHGEWHIDHIVPIATAQTIEEAVKLNHISNLQPLWARDNLTKGSSVEG